MRYMRYILFLSVISLVACGPTKEEWKKIQIARTDSIRAMDSITAIMMADSMYEESGKSDSREPLLRGGGEYWSSSETGLPVGIVYDFHPQNTEDPEYNPAGPFYVIVKTPDGKLVSTETDRKLWFSIKPNQIIK